MLGKKSTYLCMQLFHKMYTALTEVEPNPPCQDKIFHIHKEIIDLGIEEGIIGKNIIQNPNMDWLRSETINHNLGSLVSSMRMLEEVDNNWFENPRYRNEINQRIVHLLLSFI